MTLPQRLLFTALCIVLPVEATAQSLDETDREMLSAFEMRVGTIAGLSADRTFPSLGAGVRLQPWSKGAAGDRLSIYVSGDFRHLGHEEIFDEPVRSRAQLGRWVLALGGALGFDVLRTSRLTIDVRGGVALLAERTSFAIDSSNGFVDDDDEWESVCGFSGFRDRCRTDYPATGTVAIGARVVLKRNGSLYAGADYTRLIRGQNVFVALIGVRSR